MKIFLKSSLLILCFFSHSLLFASCNQSPGQADSYVLALSWHAGFCQTHGIEVGKPECQSFQQNSYADSHLVLHGLWPNQKACGANYGYCGVQQQQSHCDYEAIELTNKVSQDLKKVMPSYAHGSCLERHEWNKHGTCQYLNTNEYFEIAERMIAEINETPFVAFIAEHRGLTISLAELRELITLSFGKETNGKITFKCNRGILVDVYLLLPDHLEKGESIYQLLQKAEGKAAPDTCPGRIKIA